MTKQKDVGVETRAKKRKPKVKSQEPKVKDIKLKILENGTAYKATNTY